MLRILCGRYAYRLPAEFDCRNAAALVRKGAPCGWESASIRRRSDRRRRWRALVGEWRISWKPIVIICIHMNEPEPLREPRAQCGHAGAQSSGDIYIRGCIEWLSPLSMDSSNRPFGPKLPLRGRRQRSQRAADNNHEESDITMKKTKNASKGAKAEASPSHLIDARITKLADWRGATLARVRALIKQADARRARANRLLLP
jgi:hypothetical protein